MEILLHLYIYDRLYVIPAKAGIQENILFDSNCYLAKILVIPAKAGIQFLLKSTGNKLFIRKFFNVFLDSRFRGNDKGRL